MIYRISMCHLSKHRRLNLKDSRKRKELSIYGLPMKLTYAGTKLLPHKLLLRIQNL